MSEKPIISAAEAAALVKDGDVLTSSGFVASAMPEALNRALENRFLETGSPRNLTLFYAAAQGNRDGSGADHFAHEGMLKRVIGGHYNMVPRLGALINENKLEAYNRLRVHCLSFIGTSQGISRPHYPRGTQYVCRSPY